MTTVVYEVKKETLIIHITKNDKKTICSLPIKEQPWVAVTKEVHCKKCWARFNG